MKRDIIKLKGAKLAINADMIAAVDIADEGRLERRTVRIFFSGVSSGYFLKCDSEKIANEVFNEIVARMQQKEQQEESV